MKQSTVEAIALFLLALCILMLGSMALDDPRPAPKPIVCTTAITVNDIPLYYNGEWHDYIPKCPSEVKP